VEPVWNIPEGYKFIFNIMTWGGIVLGGLWLVTGVMGYMHRRAYNLTHAESGRNQKIKPDFLKVNKKAREEAMERGEAYDEKLDVREGAPPPPAPAAFLERLARAGATITALFGLIAAVVGTLTRAGSLQAGIEEIASFDKLMTILRNYPLGAAVAVIVVAANVIAFYTAEKKKKKHA
jgi:hypothetical protein